jgi:hypothetical protein
MGLYVLSERTFMPHLPAFGQVMSEFSVCLPDLVAVRRILARAS